MKTQIKCLAILVTIALVTISCSSEDDNGNTTTNSTIEVNFNENPRSGDLVTTITSNLSGELTYTITSQTIGSSFTLNNFGELRVANWQVFDYEVNPIIGATVSITNGSDTDNKIIAVNINDVDDIWSFLDDSRTSYESAAPGQWIKVTEAEYNDLANYLYDVTKSGATDAQYNINDPIFYDSAYYTYANNNGATIPEEHYVFAFKYICDDNNLTNTKVKLSTTSVSEGYSNLGGDVPSHDSGENYFVLKGNNTFTAEMSYLAVGADRFGYYNGTSGFSFKYGAFDVNELPYNWVGIALYQGLSTPRKQWD